jgi:hypothetical protein
VASSNPAIPEAEGAGDYVSPCSFLLPLQYSMDRTLVPCFIPLGATHTNDLSALRVAKSRGDEFAYLSRADPTYITIQLLCWKIKKAELFPRK